MMTKRKVKNDQASRLMRSAVAHERLSWKAHHARQWREAERQAAMAKRLRERAKRLRERLV